MAITITLPTPPRLNIPRIAWVILGVVCLALLVWLLGPLLPLGSAHPLAGWLPRLLVIGLLAAGTAGAFWWRRHRAKSANDAMMRDLAQPADTSAPQEDLSAADVQAMEERATKALALMWGGRVGREKELAYELPWYVMIGPPGAGKTTALQNAGLNFPVSQELGAEPLRGIGGTRTCEWWFTDRAVLIDTAGRYTTQDSEAAVDAKGWNGLLDILKRHRPRQPVTGVFVAIAATDLLAADEEVVAAHGRAVRSRINEIATKFGVRTPVYVLLTKLDLLAGFTEFFDGFDATAREQVWGETFPLTTGAPAGGLGATGQATTGSGGDAVGIGAALEALVTRLGEFRLDRVQAERDMLRRGSIFAFPQQFAALASPLASLVAIIGRETRFEPTPLLRGVYFTSATQTGRPMDRLLSSLAARFGVDESPAQESRSRGRSYFLRDLLGKVVFAESALAGRDPAAERRRRLMRLGVIGGASALVLLLTAAWVYGWAANGRLISRLAQRDAQLKTDLQALGQGDVSDSDLQPLLPVLDEARALPFGSTAAKGDRSPGFTFGVGQAGALRPQVDGAYRNLLNRLMLPRLVLQLEDRLRALTSGADNAGKDAQSQTYNVLRVYLMLGRAPGAPMRAGQIQGWFENAWADRYPSGEDDPTRDALSAHLRTLLSGPLTPPSLDRDLIAAARQQVAGLSPGERVYTRLVDDPELRGLQPYALANVAEVSSSGLFTRRSGKSLALGVPGMFRHGAFYGPVLTAIGKAAAENSDEAWVTGEAAQGSSVAQAGRIKDGILIAYLADFTRRWDEYIGDIAISGKYPMDERIHRAVRPPSPVKALFASLAAETNLAPPSLARGKGGAGMGALRTAALFSRTIYSGVNRADQIGAANAYNGPAQKGPLDEVIDHFAWLRDLQPASGPSPLDDALDALKETGDSTLAAKAAGGMGDATLQKDKTSSAMASATKLKSASAGLPSVAGGLFNDFVNASTTTLNASAKVSLNQAWTQAVLPECRSILAQGFPFHGGEHQVSVDDFSRLLRPGGLLDAFESANLAGNIDKGSTWTPSAAGKALGLNPASIRDLQKADVVRRAFFKPGDIRPNVRFMLEPISLPATASLVTLTVDGTPAAFQSGSRKPVELHWPGGSGGVTLAFQSTGSGQPATHSWTGDWALARMIAESRVTNANSGGLTFETAVDGVRASFRMRFLNTTNPFTLPELKTLACPSGF